jgi:hypothetical protein
MHFFSFHCTVKIFINRRSPNKLEYKVIPIFPMRTSFLMKLNMSFSLEVSKEKKSKNYNIKNNKSKI